MRRTLNIGIGLGTAAIVATMAAGVASATTGGHQQAGGPAAAAVSSVNRHITRAQARQIARAKVPHSRVIETQSDDRHDRAVWKVELRTRRGQVVVDVDKRTGHAVVVRRGGGGDDDAIAASRIASASWRGEPGDDRGADVIAAGHGRDARDHDGARAERGDRHDHDGRHHHRGDRHDHDRGDDGAGR